MANFLHKQTDQGDETYQHARAGYEVDVSRAVLCVQVKEEETDPDGACYVHCYSDVLRFVEILGERTGFECIRSTQSHQHHDVPKINREP